MKTILVLTDFTIRADHAAHYALRLAQDIKANLLLCNVYPEVTVKPASAHTYWSTDNFGQFEEDSKNDLKELAGRLSKQQANTGNTEFKPEIEICSKSGPLINAINYLVASRSILMAVIATHNADDYLTFLTGNHAAEILDHANCPVLVVPYQVPFQVFKRIAFATDLTRHRDVLHTLHNITKCSNPDIFITHVGTAPLGTVTEQYILKQLLGEDTDHNAACPKLHYTAVQNKNVVAGLNDLAEHADIDLMVLVHRKRNFLKKLFQGSVTKQLANHYPKPMLVFPWSHQRESYPVH
jgi:nucleotide-binding universal stress UspA family protein